MYVQTLSDNKKGANLKESHYICFKTLKFIKTSKNEKIFLPKIFILSHKLYYKLSIVMDTL